MVLSLGDVRFGVGADTRGLRDSMLAMARFGQTVERVSAQTDKSRKAEAAALRRQESAITGALQKVIALNQQIRQAGAGDKYIARNARAFKELTDAIGKTNVSALAMQRALTSFDARLKHNTRSLSDFKKRTSTAKDAAEQMAQALRNMQSASTIALGPLSGLGARIQAITAIANRSTLALAALIAGATGAALALQRLASASVRTGQEFRRVDARLGAVSATVFQAGETFDYLTKLADDAGVEFFSLANAFAKLSAAANGTTLEGEGIKKVFEDMTFGASKFQLETIQMEGVLRALEQMLSKGTIQAEELRGQLGDRLPGAFVIAARALNVTTSELNQMLKAGKVLSEDALPKIAAEFRRTMGADQVDRIENMQASLNRLTNANNAMTRSFDETFGITDLYIASVEGLTSVLKGLADNMQKVAAIAGGVVGAMVALAAPQIYQAIVFIGNALKSVAVAVLALNTAMNANPAVLFATVVQRLGIALAGAALGYGIMSAATIQAKSKHDQLTESIEQFIFAQRKQQESVRSTAEALLTNVDRELAAYEKQQARIAELRAKFDRKEISSNTFFNEMRPLLAQTKAVNAMKRQREELVAIIESEKLREAELAKEKEASIRRLTAGLDQVIQKYLAQAAATSQGAAAVKAVNLEFERTDAIQSFYEKLLKLEIGMDIVKDKTDEFTAAYDALQSAIQNNALKNAAEQVANLQKELAATNQGPQALKQFKDALRIDKEVQSFTDQLIAVGVSMNEANARADLFRQALLDLQSAADAIKLDKVTSGIERAIMVAEGRTNALGNGAKALEEFDRKLAQLDSLDDWQRQLVEAGMEVSKAEALVNRLGNAMEMFYRKTANIKIAEAMADAERSIASVRAEAEALAKGPKALDAFKDMEQINNTVSQYTKRLIDAGVASDVAARKSAEFGAALANLFQMRRDRANAGADNFDFVGEIQKIQAQADALAVSQAYASRFKDELGRSEQIDTFKKKLLSLGVAVEEANAFTRVFTNALVALKEAAANIEVADATQQIERINAELAAMDEGQQAVERLKATFSRIDAIEKFRNNLIAAGVAMDTAYALTGQFEAALNTLAARTDKIRVDKAFTSATEELERLQQRLAAVSTGGSALDKLNAQFERSDRVESYRQALIDAGVATQDAAALTERFATSLEALDSRVAAIKVAEVIANINTAIGEFTQQAAAVTKGEDALNRLNDAIGRQKQIDEWRERLIKAGVSASQAEVLVTRLAAAMNLFNSNMARAQVDKTLGDVAKQIKDMQGELAATTQGPQALKQFKDALRIDREVDDFVKRLTGVGVALDVAVGHAATFREALEDLQAAADQIKLDAVTKDIESAIAAVEGRVGALNQGARALEEFNRKLNDTNTLDNWKRQLIEAGMETAKAEELVKRLATAMEAFNRKSVSIKIAEAVSAASEEIERLQQRLQAVGRSDSALDKLNAQFDQSDRIRKYNQALINAGVTVQEAAALTDKYTAALQALDSQIASIKAAEVIGNINEAINEFGQRTTAINQGEQALSKLNAAIARQKQIKEWRDNLAAAGVEIERADGLLRALARAMDLFNEAVARSKIDSAFGDFDKKMARIAEETAALRGGKNAFEAFQDVTTVRDNVDALTKSLRDAGVAEEEIARRAEIARRNYEENVAARRNYENSNRRTRTPRDPHVDRELEDAIQRLQSVKAIQESIYSTGNLDLLVQAEGQAEVNKKVHDYEQRLREAGVAQELVKTKAIEFRGILDSINGRQYDTFSASVAAAANAMKSVNQELALVKNINPRDLAFGESYATSVAEYNLRLKELGLSQEIVNQKTAVYKERLQELLQQRSAISEAIQAHEAMISAVERGFTALGDALLDAAISGEFNLRTLADIGKQVASEILSAFLRLAVIKPLLDSIFDAGSGGSSKSSAGGIFSKIVQGIIGGIAGGIGGGTAVKGASGGFKMYAKGGILGAPTMFNTPTGPAIAAEREQEAIMPLVRDKNGDLSVKAVGAGRSSPTYVNNNNHFHFPPGTDVKSFMKSQSQIAARLNDATLLGNRNA